MPSTSPDNKFSAPMQNIAAWMIVFIVLASWIASWALLHGDPDRGTFGDMFGAINALYSGLAFAGVVYAIVLQRQELELQRQELALTREELAGTRSAQESQAKTLATTAELSVLNTLVQDAVLKEHNLKEAASRGAYNIDGYAVATLIENTQKERKNYISRMKQIIADSSDAPEEP